LIGIDRIKRPAVSPKLEAMGYELRITEANNDSRAFEEITGKSRRINPKILTQILMSGAERHRFKQRAMVFNLTMVKLPPFSQRSNYVRSNNTSASLALSLIIYWKPYGLKERALN
tara:strand:- start:1421 stop:1768 length:348 start_codon:yes stop_codon:yes gene_type:complete